MQDYHIYAHYIKEQNVSKTSPNYRTVLSKTKAAPETQEEKSNSLNLGGIRQAATVSLAAINKINTYVGEYTENIIMASRMRTGISYAGMALAATVNPVLGVSAMALYTADKMLTYNIKVNKENLSANFIRQLSGGSVSTRR